MPIQRNCRARDIESFSRRVSRSICPAISAPLSAVRLAMRSAPLRVPRLAVSTLLRLRNVVPPENLIRDDALVAVW